MRNDQPILSITLTSRSCVLRFEYFALGTKGDSCLEPNVAQGISPHDAYNGPNMKLLVYAFLFIAAAVLVIGLVIGLAFKLIGFAVAALLVVAGVTWVMNKIRGPKPPVERLTR